MILDELRKELNEKLCAYLKRFKSNNVPIQRQADINFINKILESQDPMAIRHEIGKLLDAISLPLYFLFTFIDVNYFVNELKDVLKKEKFQEINLLRSLVREKNQVIDDLKKENILIKDNFNKISAVSVVDEINLLRSENKFLYQTLEKLEKKISILEEKYHQPLPFDSKIPRREEIHIKEVSVFS